MSISHKFRKVLLVSFVSLLAAAFAGIILIMAAFAFGPSKDDMVLFHGQKYAISKTPTGFSLFDYETGEIIPNVTGYWTEDGRSYIRNSTHLVTIDELQGTYEIKEISNATALEEDILKAMKLVESSS